MTDLQKLVKYGAIALAAILIFSIFGGALRLLAVVGFLTKSDPVADEMTVYDVSQNVSALELKVKGVDLTVQQGNDFSVESNLNDLKVTVNKDGKMTIREQGTFTQYSGAKLILTIPADVCLQKAELELGAGRVSASCLRAEKLVLNLGAGDVSFDHLEGTDSAQIECGMGNLTIQSGVLNDLKLDLGMGNTQLSASVSGNSRCACGVGELSLTLLGGMDQYRVAFSKGIGTIRVNGEPLTAANETVGNGENHLSVQGGMGKIDLSFEP